MREERTVDLPFSFEKVRDAARRVFEQEGWSVKNADKAAGRYEAVVSIPSGRVHLPIPSIEKFQVNITRIEANSTKVHAAIRFEQWHWGTTAWHVNTFFAELQRQLDS